MVVFLKISPFYLDLPNQKAPPLPILASIPHCGTELPSDFLESADKKSEDLLADTDWFVDQLFNFLPDLGVRRIYAKMSRSLIDLNRPLDNSSLYQDPGRLTTGLFPMQNFKGEPLFAEPPSLTSQQQRISLYYRPYHEMLEKLLNELSEQHPHVLLLELHSIKRHVPRIYPNPLPDFILGNQDGKTCHPALLVSVADVLQEEGGHSLAINHPFKGGEITRKYAAPNRGRHCLQIEMSQDIYLKQDLSFDDLKLGPLRTLFKSMILRLGEALIRL